MSVNLVTTSKKFVAFGLAHTSGIDEQDFSTRNLRAWSFAHQKIKPSNGVPSRAFGFHDYRRAQLQRGVVLFEANHRSGRDGFFGNLKHGLQFLPGGKSRSGAVPVYIRSTGLSDSPMRKLNCLAADAVGVMVRKRQHARRNL